MEINEGSIKNLKVKLGRVMEERETQNGKRLKKFELDGGVLVLWENDCDLDLKEGDEIIMINGYCKTYAETGEKQVMFGKFGSFKKGDVFFKKQEDKWKNV